MLALMPKLLAGGLALGLAVAAASKAKAADAPDMPPTLVNAMVQAIASRDPGVMRAVAVKLESLGYPLPAADLRKTADEVEAENQMSRTQAALMPTAPVVSVGPSPTVSSTGAITPVPAVSPGTPASAAQVLAAKVALNLHSTAAGRENRDLLKQFQKQEGLVVDGYYGPKSAIAFIKYGIVPETPRQWPKADAATAKAAYASVLRSQAAADPTRAEEWTRAANAVSSPAKVAPAAAKKPVPLPKAKDYTGDPNELAKRMAAAAGFQTDPGALGIGLNGDNLGGLV
jgi:hypothetical protein